MTESPSAETKSSRPSRFIIPAVVVVVLIAVVGYFVAMQSGLDKAAVEEALNNWGKQVEAYAAKEGKELRFAYDRVEMKGHATDRHALVHNPRFVTKLAGEGDTPKDTTFRTESLLLYPQSIRFDALRVRLDKPITVETEGQAVGRITAATPIDIDVAQRDDAGRRMLDTTIPIPAEWKIESIEDKQTMTIRMNEGARIVSSMASDDRGIGSFSAVIDNLQAADDNQTPLLSFKSLRIETVSVPVAPAEGQKADALPVFDASVNAAIDELMGTAEDMPYGAVSIAFQADYEGPLPKEGETPDWAVTPSHMQVRTLSMKTADAAFDAQADFKTGSGDLLPVGTAQVKVTNVPFIVAELRKAEGWNEQNEVVLNALLQRMVGTGIDATQDLDVKLAREAGGSLKIGNTTFEEALAIVLTGGKLAPRQPADAAPGDAAPAAPGDTAPGDAEPAAGQ